MATSVSKLLISLTKFSNKTSKVIDATDSFNATGSFYQDVSGWDSAVVQIVSPSETISFKTTNDDNAVLGDLLPAPEVPTNWLTLEGINLADKTNVSSVSASANVAFGIIGKYLQLEGATVSTAPSFAYLLSRDSNGVAANAIETGVSIGAKVVYASTATPTSVTAFYGDSALTQPVFGDGNYYAYRLMTGNTINAALITLTGAVSVYSPTTTTTTTASPGLTLYASTNSGGDACTQTGPIYTLTSVVIGGGTTICDASNITSSDIDALSLGNYYISNGVDYVQANKSSAGTTMSIWTICTTC